MIFSWTGSRWAAPVLFFNLLSARGHVFLCWFLFLLGLGFPSDYWQIYPQPTLPLGALQGSALADKLGTAQRAESQASHGLYNDVGRASIAVISCVKSLTSISGVLGPQDMGVGGAYIVALRDVCANVVFHPIPLRWAFDSSSLIFQNILRGDFSDPIVSR